MQIWKIDMNNFFTGESYFVNKNEENYIQNDLEIEKPYDVGYIKGKWNGTDWEEGAIHEEIAEWQEQNKPLPQPPTETEKLWDTVRFLLEADGYIPPTE